MAKRGNDQDTGAEKAKVRVFFAEVEGSNDSVREALKTMVAAMNRPVQVLGPAQRVLISSGTSMPSTGVAPVTEGQPDPEFSEATDTIEAPANGERRKRGVGPKKDRNAGIELVPHITFVPSGKKTLKDFFAAKGPKTDMEQILVLAYYMQHTLSVSEMGPGHVLTAFKHVGTPVPVDLRATMRNMKRDKAWLSFTSGTDGIRVTTQGENFVEHELPKKGE